MKSILLEFRKDFFEEEKSATVRRQSGTLKRFGNSLLYYEPKDFKEDIKTEIIAMSETSIKRFLEGARKAFDRKRNISTTGGGALKLKDWL